MKAMYYIKIERKDGETRVTQPASARKALHDFNLVVRVGNLCDKSVSIYKVGETLPKRVHLFNV